MTTCRSWINSRVTLVSVHVRFFVIPNLYVVQYFPAPRCLAPRQRFSNATFGGMLSMGEMLISLKSGSTLSSDVVTLAFPSGAPCGKTGLHLEHQQSIVLGAQVLPLAMASAFSSSSVL